jgi:DNA-binding NarL/FixJ family response regulator
MSTDRRVIVASRKTDLSWALHHEVSRHAGMRLIANVDPREAGALDRIDAGSDVVLIEAEDLLWLWSNANDAVVRTVAKVRTVVILADTELLDVMSRTRGNCGLLLRAEYGSVPVDILELAILGYMSMSSMLLRRIAGNRLRLDLVAGLSADEMMVLAHLGGATSNRRIAEMVGLTESRVKTLVHLVTRKLRLTNRTGVAVFATTNDLAGPSIRK